MSSYLSTISLLFIFSLPSLYQPITYSERSCHRTQCLDEFQHFICLLDEDKLSSLRMTQLEGITNRTELQTKALNYSDSLKSWAKKMKINQKINKCKVWHRLASSDRNEKYMQLDWLISYFENVYACDEGSPKKYLRGFGTELETGEFTIHKAFRRY